jgi:hypothetical protein
MCSIIQSLLPLSSINSFASKIFLKKQTFMKRLIFGALTIIGALVMNFNSFSVNARARNDRGETKTVNVDDAKIAYRIYGNKEGTPIVLLSPLGSSMDDWDPSVINGLLSIR